MIDALNFIYLLSGFKARLFSKFASSLLGGPESNTLMLQRIVWPRPLGAVEEGVADGLWQEEADLLPGGAPSLASLLLTSGEVEAPDDLIVQDLLVQGVTACFDVQISTAKRLPLAIIHHRNQSKNLLQGPLPPIPLHH